MADHRRSSPDHVHRSLGYLYPVALDSDPKELASQATELFTQHARAHENSLTTQIANNTRITGVEEAVKKLDERDDRIEQALVEGFNKIEKAMSDGFQSVNLERTVDRTKARTAWAVIVVVWTLLVGLGGVAGHYLTKPNCKPDEALIGDRCVQVTSVVVK